MSLTAERVRELLDYNPETGVFTWKVARGKSRIGATAGHTNRFLGYVLLGIDGNTFYAHRLAWLYVHGRWPADQIDHINGNRADNRLVNLREATRAENQQNLHLRSNTTSGYLGVGWHKQTGRWRSRIAIDGHSVHLGLFDSAQDAHAAYLVAKSELHTFQPTLRKAS